jgi:HPt (histidine-containing phosphotransfer) domain-containing protein
MDEIVKDFLIESNENLDRLDQESVQLETDPTSKPLLDGIFRTIHTSKGSCGFLGFSRLEKVARTGESLLSKLREGKLTLSEEISSGLLAMVDAVRHTLTEIQATEKDGDNDYPELLTQLKSLEGDNQEAVAVLPAPPPKPDTSPASSGIRILEVEAPVAPVASVSSAGTAAPSTAPSAVPSTAHGQPQDSAIAQQFRPSPSKIGGLLVDRGRSNPTTWLLLFRNKKGVTVAASEKSWYFFGLLPPGGRKHRAAHSGSALPPDGSGNRARGRRFARHSDESGWRTRACAQPASASLQYRGKFSSPVGRAANEPDCHRSR